MELEPQSMAATRSDWCVEGSLAWLLTGAPLLRLRRTGDREP
jgi:hypothetical protein